MGAADSRAFDGDADLGALGLGGVPVTVAFSLWTGFAWAGSLGTVILLQPSAFSWPTRALIGIAVLIAAPSISWCATRVLVRLLRRLHPDEPGPSSPHSVGPTRKARAERQDDGPLRSDHPAPRLHGRRRAA